MSVIELRGVSKKFTGHAGQNAALLGLSRRQTDEAFERIVEFRGIREFIGEPNPAVMRPRHMARPRGIDPVGRAGRGLGSLRGAADCARVM
jgi:hypothetical protein